MDQQEQAVKAWINDNRSRGVKLLQLVQEQSVREKKVKHKPSLLRSLEG